MDSGNCFVCGKEQFLGEANLPHHGYKSQLCFDCHQEAYDIIGKAEQQVRIKLRDWETKKRGK